MWLSTCRLAPLCLHQRVSTDVFAAYERQAAGEPEHATPGGGGALPFSELSLSGSFSLSEVHAWVAAALPELPPHPPSAAGGGGVKGVGGGGGQGDVRYGFRSSQAGSMLGVSLAAGGARFVRWAVLLGLPRILGVKRIARVMCASKQLPKQGNP